MNGERPPQAAGAAGTGAAGHASRTLGLVYDISVLATAGSSLFFMFAAHDAGMYAAAGLGAIASFAIGYVSLQRRLTALGSGLVRYCRLWVGMTAVSALSLISGRWQPLVLFALAGVLMSLIFLLGGWLGSRRAAPPERG